MQGVDLFITITDRSRAEQFAAWFRTHGISLVLTALGQGTATTEVLDFLGLEATEKAVLFCVSPRSPRLVRQAARDLWLDVPGQGVLMTVPVNSIGGSTAKEYLLHEQEGETAMEREIAHDLIVVIANQGSTDLVMDAAREAGATGGTVIHAKGTGTDLVRKFFGVSIASEQEMVFILARSEAKKPIMKAIMAKAGISSRLVAFADDCVGHRRGGIAIVAVIVACFFGAISGSGPATVAALGIILIPAMINRGGFSAPFASSLMASASSIAIVIPPSIAFVVYASITGVSVGDMFMGGWIPGIMMGLSLVIIIMIECRKKGIQIGRASCRERV